MKWHYRGLAAAGLLWLALAQAQTSTQRFTPNFQNVDIMVLADVVGRATGITFIPDPRAHATVSLINPKPMTGQQLYQTFLSILQVNGLAAVPSGPNEMKIVPEASVRQMATPVLPGKVNPNSDEMVTTVIELKNVNAQQLYPVLRQLVPPAGVIQSVAGTNALLITDRASNVARIEKIAERLDEGGGSGSDMVQLKNSNASDVVRTLTPLLAGTPAETASGAVPRVVADDRSNSVLISGDATSRKRVADLIATLDKPVDDNNNTVIRQLKYAKAEDVVTTLKAQASATAAAAGGTGGAAAAPAAVAGPAADRTVNILADQATNQIIITAPPKTRQALMAIVDALDIRRTQVMIEAFIADVSMDKSSDLGMNWALGKQSGGKVLPGAVFNTPVGSASGNPLDIVGLAQIVNDPSSATIDPQGLTLGVAKLASSGLSVAAMIRAIASDTNTNVVAMPTQVTLDNEEVNLESGQQVPFITGQYTNAGGGNNGAVNPFNTVNRQDVGTKLKITPQLNGSDAMTLTIDLESSELTSQVGDAGSPITNTRTFHNVVFVKNGQTVVIGGLIRDSKIAGESRVPFLSRIPIFGNLFKVKNAKRQKTNLMVFIKPTIITDDAEVATATNTKSQQVRDAQQEQGKHDSLPPPQLPDMNPSAASMPASAAPAGKQPQTSPVP